MTSFEYKVVTTEKGFWSGKDKIDIEKMLNNYGRDNWELISVIPVSISGAGTTTGIQFFFKRKRF
jgi:hypothetical protein